MSRLPAQMSPAELARYMHAHIPLTKAMGVSVVSVEEDALTLEAPLAPNINHRQSVFGGSASALAILAGWALLHVRLHSEGIADRLVIQRNTMEYQHPILGAFTARAMLGREWTPSQSGACPHNVTAGKPRRRRPSSNTWT